MAIYIYTAVNAGNNPNNLIAEDRTLSAVRAKSAPRLITIIGNALSALLNDGEIEEALATLGGYIERKLDPLDAGGGVLIKLQAYINAHGSSAERGDVVFGSVSVVGWGDTCKAAIHMYQSKPRSVTQAPTNYLMQETFTWIEKGVSESDAGEYENACLAH